MSPLERLLAAIATQSVAEVHEALATAPRDQPSQGGALLRAAIDGGSLAVVRRLVEGGWSTPMVSWDDDRSLVEYAVRRAKHDLAAYLGRFVSPSRRLRARNFATRMSLPRNRYFPPQHEGGEIYGALERGDVREVERILALRDPATRFEDKTDTPLLVWAVETTVFPQSSAEPVRILLNMGAPVDSATSPRGKTPLMAAAHAGRIDVVEMLIAAGASPSKVDAQGWNALMYVAELMPTRGLEIADALIDVGVSIAARTRLGNSATMLALLFGHRELADHLRARGAPEEGINDALLCRACMDGDASGIERALGDGASRDAHDEDGTPALVLAAKTGSASAVGALLDSGFSVSVRSEGGDTALHAACSAASLAVIAQLVAAGADVAAENSEGDSPLLCARRAGGGSAVDFLQEHCRSVVESAPTATPKLIALRCLIAHGTEAASAESVQTAVSSLREAVADEHMRYRSQLLTAVLDWVIENHVASIEIAVLGLESEETEHLDAALTAIEQIPALVRSPTTREAVRRALDRRPDEVAAIRLTRVLEPLVC